MGRSVRFWWRVFAALVAAAAGFGLGLHRVEVWTLSPWLGVTLVAAGVAVAFVASTEAAVDQYRHGRFEELREQARAILAPLLIELEEETGISARKLGVAAYRVRRSPVPFRRPRLERLLRIQLVVSVSSGVTWRPGVGVVGQCVERGEDVVENLALLDEHLADVEADEWSSVPSDLTYGFSYEEYRHVRGKYGVVMATPMIKETRFGSKVIGCVAVDAPEDGFEAMAAEEVRGLVAAAAVTLASLIARQD